MKPLLPFFSFFISLVSISFNAPAQNSMTGDGFGGRSWYKAHNYQVGAYSAYTVCDSNNQLYGWGHNEYGELGSGTTNNTLAPVKALGMTQVQFYSTGYVSAAIKDDKTAWVWGLGFPFGNSTSGFSTTPVQILANVKFADCGINHAVFVKNDGTVWGVGRNSGGQLGTGSTSLNPITSPVQMTGITNAVRAVAIGWASGNTEGATVILLSNGTVKITGGFNFFTTQNSTIPLTLSGLNSIVDIKGNNLAGYALNSVGEVFSFGKEQFSYPALGLGSYTGLVTPPTKITFPIGAAPIIALSANNDGLSALALDENGKVYGWGGNLQGQLGDGTNVKKNLPVLVATHVIDIFAGETFSYILKSDNTLWAAGRSRSAPDESVWMNLLNIQRNSFSKVEPTLTPMNLCAPKVFGVVSCVNAPAIPTVTTTQPNCTIATGSITITAPIDSTLKYSSDSGATYTTSTAFPNLAAGVYHIIVKDTVGCISQSTVITINPVPFTPPPPTVSTSQPTCASATGTLTITSTAGGWIYSNNGINYSSATTFTNLVPGTYNITIRSFEGCMSPATTVIINPAPGTPPAPTLAVTQPDCTTSTGSITITNPIGATFTYSIDGVSYANTTGTFTSLASGSYNVTAKNNYGCTSTATVAVINTDPKITQTPTVIVTQPTCLVPTGIIEVTSPIANATSYSIDGITYSPNNVFNGVASGTYNVTVNNGSCNSAATVAVVNAVPSFLLALSATPNPVNAGSIVRLEVTGNTAFTVTGWQPVSIFTNQTATIQNIVVNTTSTYTVTGKSADDCYDTAQTSLSVKSSDDIWIPNTFTPNKDGRNDIFYVYGTAIDKLELTIWNQWGQMIFTTKDKNTGWDGTSKGKPQPTGVYVYVAKVVLLSGKEVVKKGSVNLIR